VPTLFFGSQQQVWPHFRQALAPKCLYMQAMKKRVPITRTMAIARHIAASIFRNSEVAKFTSLTHHDNAHISLVPIFFAPVFSGATLVLPETTMVGISNNYSFPSPRTEVACRTHINEHHAVQRIGTYTFPHIHTGQMSTAMAVGLS